MFPSSLHSTSSLDPGTIRKQPKKSTPRSVENSSDFKGRLLQIHPVDLDNGLITIGDDALTVGRSLSVNLSISDSAVSREHARFSKTDDGYVVTDLGSTNGTWVNDVRVKSRELISGDRVRIGSRIFKFIATDQLEAQYYEAVYSMMTRDTLTGAWNKRYLLDMLTRELKRRSRTKRPLALLMLDLDHFKQINDKHGHLVGDDILAEMASRILGLTRDEDIFARFGGEEFCILLAETSKEEAQMVAERCRQAISQNSFKTDDSDLECTVSIGIGMATGDDRLSPEGLIQRADENLYLAKSQGRDCVVS